jgi:iduronate 2-sulfatase
LRLYDFFSYWRTEVGNFTTLPQYFKEHGYRTYSIGKVFHPGESSNFSDDWPLSWSEPAYHPSTDQFTNMANCFEKRGGPARENLICPVDVDTQPGGTLPDTESMLRAKQFLESTTQPFFLAVGFHKPHIPLRYPREYLKHHKLYKFAVPDIDYRPPGIPDVAWNPFMDIIERDDIKALNISFPDGVIPRDYRLRIRQGYYAAVTYVDDLIGQVMQSVDLNNTVVVLTGDHGWSLGEHSEWAKYSNFDVAVKVPLIVVAPESKRRDKVTEVVELVDLFPTLVDLSCLPALEECTSRQQQTCTEGKSLAPLLRGQFSPGDQVAFSQYPRPSAYSQHNSDKPRLKAIKIMGYSLRTPRFRYTCWIGFNPRTFVRNWHQMYGEELYDHSIDSDEYMNLADRQSIDSLKVALKRILRSKFP